MSNDAMMTDAVEQLKLDDAAGRPQSLADVTEDARRTGEEHKENGNKLFAAKHYAAAIEEYTKAIDLNPVREWPGDRPWSQGREI